MLYYSPFQLLSYCVIIDVIAMPFGISKYAKIFAYLKIFYMLWKYNLKK